MMRMANFFSTLVGYLLLMVLFIVNKPSVIAISLDNNFESGTLYPWIDQSKSGVKWKIENRNSPWEPDNVPSLPANGTNYLRVDRGTLLSFGVAVLRSPVFTIPPGSRDTTFDFSFWIRSKWPQFTNLELYLDNNGNEGLLLNLYEYSNVNNRVWRQSETVTITDNSFSNLTLVFYAYCGTDIEDAVAIDNLRFITSQVSTSTTTSSGTAVDTSPMTSSTQSTSQETKSTTYGTGSTPYETEATTLTDFMTSAETSPDSTTRTIRPTTLPTRRTTTTTPSTGSTNSTDEITTNPITSTTIDETTEVTNSTEVTTTEVTDSTEDPTTDVTNSTERSTTEVTDSTTSFFIRLLTRIKWSDDEN